MLHSTDWDLFDRSKRKSFIRDLDIGSQKICFILSHILNVQINEEFEGYSDVV